MKNEKELEGNSDKKEKGNHIKLTVSEEVLLYKQIQSKDLRKTYSCPGDCDSLQVWIGSPGKLLVWVAKIREFELL